MFFAVIAVGLLGFVSLATEVGTWYLTRSAADNAADASAIAGALAISNGASTSDAQAAATDTATDNGYTTSGAVTVTANILPATGSNTNSPAEVLINVTVTPILASLFGSGTPTIASRSVAIVNPGNPACVLSTIGDLVITQNQGSFNAYNCTYASNASDSTAVNITGGATITAYGVTSMGSCTGCQGQLLERPAASYQPPTINPYATPAIGLDTLALPTPWQNSEATIPDGTCHQYGQSLTVSGPYAMVPTTANGTFNSNSYSWTTGQPYFAYENMCLNIQAGATVTMVPGTYIFYNASLSVTGGSIQCLASLAPSAPPCAQGTQGVTIIFMGSPSTNVGNLTISSSVAVNLSSPVSQASFNGTTTLANSSAFGSAYQALNGVLFYRLGQANGESAGAPGVNIAGAASTLLNGGMYFPNSYVSYGANGTTVPSCSIIVAGYLTLTNQPSQFNYAGCNINAGPYYAPVPPTQLVQVVE